jgi:prepilin-type N-terminal cleavage/methylation domain-containing protein
MTALRRIGRRLAAPGRDARGFTLIEVLVAMLVTLVVIGAMSTTFIQNNDSALAGQRQAQLYSVAQQQIEKIRTIVSRYGFSALALTAKPTAPTDAVLPTNPTDPNDFIRNWSSSSPSYLIEINYNDSTQGQISSVASNNGEPLEISATTGQVTPSATATVGSGTATVYTYVTQATVPCLTRATALTGVANTCAADDARRVVVAVKLANPTTSQSIGPNAPVYVSTVFSNPIPSNQPSSAIGLHLGLNIG